MSKADDTRYATTDGKPPAPGYEDGPAPQPIGTDGQHGAYWVLSDAERAKGFVRPVRRAYKHKTCGGITRMGLALCETYAANPHFYGSTFCVACGKHFPVAEFNWEEDGAVVGT